MKDALCQGKPTRDRVISSIAKNCNYRQESTNNDIAITNFLTTWWVFRFPRRFWKHDVLVRRALWTGLEAKLTRKNLTRKKPSVWRSAVFTLGRWGGPRSTGKEFFSSSNQEFSQTLPAFTAPNYLTALIYSPRLQVINFDNIIVAILNNRCLN